MCGCCVHTDGDISVIADIAGIASLLNVGWEDAELELGVFFKLGDFPGAGGVDYPLAEREQALRIRIFHSFKTFGQEGFPIRKILPGLDISCIRKLGSAFDQSQAAFLTLPV